MKSARDVAIDVAFEFSGAQFSRPIFEKILEDTGEAGRTLKRLVDIIERGIKNDRTMLAAEKAPN